MIAENNAKMEKLKKDYEDDVKATKTRPEYCPDGKIARLTRELEELQAAMERLRTVINNVVLLL